ncbi:hypothetical protein PAAG_03824 [Paracoccidioides lutzii Pb01]|uniref:Uncharacterized protein n=1 Tax=Paracoccidioides lutzii (strain ATCC MYA-826 / Pb01) TaxID=502779 RepID=C1GZ80_PARBA|nr:hypothetical protein PAAG_03824 [Paracoccidioides lutzii Pb01]EEH41903.2 hypothetical protein PAAG_03824 [Paracoccidioides lutzii Pb01]
MGRLDIDALNIGKLEVPANIRKLELYPKKECESRVWKNECTGKDGVAESERKTKKHKNKPGKIKLAAQEGEENELGIFSQEGRTASNVNQVTVGSPNTVMQTSQPEPEPKPDCVERSDEMANDTKASLNSNSNLNPPIVKKSPEVEKGSVVRVEPLESHIPLEEPNCCVLAGSIHPVPQVISRMYKTIMNVNQVLNPPRDDA